MKENHLLLTVLVVLLGTAYWSWTKEEKKVTTEKVVMVSGQPADIELIRFTTKTQTVSVSRRDLKGEAYVWFEIASKTRTRGFVGNDKVDDLLKSFAPFSALRSLGPVEAEKLEAIKLKKPEKKLTLRIKGAEKVFQIGDRTYGSRDHDVKPTAGKEVYLVESKVLGDLEYPESRFMQRNLRKADMQEVNALEVTAGGKTRRFLHQNRLAKAEAYWATDTSPEQQNETVGNWVSKLDTLSVRTYPEDADVLKDATLVLELAWIDPGDKKAETMALYRKKAEKGDAQDYFAVGTATKLPVEVTRSVAEQLERDLAVLYSEK
jgi:hypothetical protein